jgi:hypothetical protein
MLIFDLLCYISESAPIIHSFISEVNHLTSIDPKEKARPDMNVRTKRQSPLRQAQPTSSGQAFGAKIQDAFVVFHFQHNVDLMRTEKPTIFATSFQSQD